MANNALDDFLGGEEKRLNNLDWLDIDPAEYKNMPFNDIPEYIAIPKLEEAWTHCDDPSGLRLVPNSDFNFSYSLPQKGKLASEKDIPDLLNFTKQQMMLGKTGDELIKAIQTVAAPGLIKSAADKLLELSKEQGLLGNVYVDPTVFTKCKEGAEFVHKKSKTAKYVKAMSSCSTCVFNNSGRCNVYKRKIAEQIEYTPEVLGFYSKHLSNVKGRAVSASSKEALQKEFLTKDAPKTKIAEFKPNIYGEDNRTLKDVDKEYQNRIDDLKKNLLDVEQYKLAKELNMLLIQGYDAKTIKESILSKYSPKKRQDNKHIFSSMLSQQGSLGEVYVNASYLPLKSCKDQSAREFFRKNVKQAKYILSGKDNHFCTCDGKKCRNLNKDVVSSVDEIPKEVWKTTFDSYDLPIREKLSSIFDSDPQKGLRLAFLQQEIGRKNLEIGEVENYNLKSEIDYPDYNPKNIEKVTLSANKIKCALNRGFPLSRIVKTAQKLGVEETSITSNIKKAFDEIKEINKYQLDIEIPVPENVKVVMSQKDTNIDLQKTQQEKLKLTFDSTNAPSEDLVDELGLKNADLDTEGVDSKYDDIEISGLGTFNIE